MASMMPPPLFAVDARLATRSCMNILRGEHNAADAVNSGGGGIKSFALQYRNRIINLY